MGGGVIRADDPIFMAGAATLETVTTVDSSGRQRIKEVRVPLVLPKETRETTSVHVQEDTTGQPDVDGGPYGDAYDEEPHRPTGTRMV
jgi:hypothetical protein